ncbi:hypothetical protein C8J55DRAFT_485842 [Lentinula edodes]|uniref:PWWP domain-containing protein n=1 Tax=Lentinula lateritia TaxID=40482 RepID=A0A9W9AY54_9AGAR|nr:hypothetical protein C8J55DRAFT_485842 [Lentinula edodes]
MSFAKGELVYAKSGSSQYWPGVVSALKGEFYEVSFFYGGQVENLAISNIRKDKIRSLPRDKLQQDINSFEKRTRLKAFEKNLLRDLRLAEAHSVGAAASVKSLGSPTTLGMITTRSSPGEEKSSKDRKTEASDPNVPGDPNTSQSRLSDKSSSVLALTAPPTKPARNLEAVAAICEATGGSPELPDSLEEDGTPGTSVVVHLDNKETTLNRDGPANISASSGIKPSYPISTVLAHNVASVNRDPDVVQEFIQDAATPYRELIAMKGRSRPDVQTEASDQDLDDSTTPKSRSPVVVASSTSSASGAPCKSTADIQAVRGLIELADSLEEDGALSTTMCPDNRVGREETITQYQYGLANISTSSTIIPSYPTPSGTDENSSVDEDQCIFEGSVQACTTEHENHIELCGRSHQDTPTGDPEGLDDCSTSKLRSSVVVASSTSSAPGAPGNSSRDIQAAGGSVELVDSCGIDSTLGNSNLVCSNHNIGWKEKRDGPANTSVSSSIEQAYPSSKALGQNVAVAFSNQSTECEQDRGLGVEEKGESSVCTKDREIHAASGIMIKDTEHEGSGESSELFHGGSLARVVGKGEDVKTGTDTNDNCSEELHRNSEGKNIILGTKYNENSKDEVEREKVVGVGRGKGRTKVENKEEQRSDTRSNRNTPALELTNRRIRAYYQYIVRTYDETTFLAYRSYSGLNRRPNPDIDDFILDLANDLETIWFEGHPLTATERRNILNRSPAWISQQCKSLRPGQVTETGRLKRWASEDVELWEISEHGEISPKNANETKGRKRPKRYSSGGHQAGNTHKVEEDVNGEIDVVGVRRSDVCEGENGAVHTRVINEGGGNTKMEGEKVAGVDREKGQTKVGTENEEDHRNDSQDNRNVPPVLELTNPRIHAYYMYIVRTHDEPTFLAYRTYSGLNRPPNPDIDDFILELANDLETIWFEGRPLTAAERRNILNRSPAWISQHRKLLRQDQVTKNGRLKRWSPEHLEPRQISEDGEVSARNADKTKGHKGQKRNPDEPRDGDQVENTDKVKRQKRRDRE